MLSEVITFLARNASALDGTDYDAWCDDFVEDCRYRVISVENQLLGHDMPLMLMKNRNMVLDRILSLRQANVYNIHRDTHILGLPLIANGGGPVRAETPFTIYQTNQDGISSLFCVGRYVDELASDGDRLKIRHRDVMVENFAVIRLLSTPL
jgi:anthranilate 1,2-dioxygenase small subunit